MKIILFVFLVFISTDTFAFVCRLNGGPEFGSGTRDVYIKVAPQVAPGENLIFDATSQIVCRNEQPTLPVPGYDMLEIMPGTNLAGPLLNAYKSSLITDLASHPFPINMQFKAQLWYDEEISPFKLKTVLTPLGNNAAGIVIKKGDKIATINVLKYYLLNDPTGNPRRFTWNIYADNDVVVPTGTCDVNSRSILVNLGDYPSDTSEKNINLSVKCVSPQTLSFYINGVTSSPSIFKNTAANNKAEGVGIQLTRNGIPVNANSLINMGIVNQSYTSLLLKAKYIEDGSDFKAGNVRSIIGVNFVYN